MSRSYRKPYCSICGAASAKSDKRLAARGVRRKQNLALATAIDYEGFLLPHKFECAWNEVYAWSRDGRQTYQSRIPRYISISAPERITNHIRWWEEIQRK